MSFFKQFPKVDYSINNDGITNQVIDIYRYVDVRDKLASNVTAYQYINLLDGERPDNLSYRIYGTPDYYWTFFILNDQFKSGLGTWPKSTYELNSKLDNEFKNIAIYHFPTRYLGDNVYTTKELPINEFKDYVKLAKITGPLVPALSAGVYDKNVYSIADIVYYENDTSQIWIDKATTQLYSPHYGDLYQTEEYSDANPNDKNKILNTSTSNLNTTWRLLFVNPYSPGDAEYENVEILKSKWLKSTVECIKVAPQDQPFDIIQDPTTEDYTNIYYWHEFYCHGIWAFGKTAPAYYYNNATGDVINDYEIYLNNTSGPNAITEYYVTYEEDAKRDNDSRTRIKYVVPSYIQQFSREYRNLINE